MILVRTASRNRRGLPVVADAEPIVLHTVPLAALLVRGERTVVANQVGCAKVHHGVDGGDWHFFEKRVNVGVCGAEIIH